ncbi:lipase family protein [Nocardia sp. NPDC048505]|uniref:lipase family protein n=1 Tax=unclassified Nocardia TaxID=2637762 RepID=UPI0034097A4C
MLTTLLPFSTAAAQPFSPSTALAHLSNGTLLETREIQLFGLPLPVRTWQLTYKSLDAENQPTTGRTTLVVPDTPWPGPRPLVSHQLAEDSLGTGCAPSAFLEHGLAARLNNGNAEAPLAVLALRRGWAVAFPDYQGPRERFLDKAQTAHSVLDALRAARAFAPADLRAAPVALAGFSGGAIASAWAAQAQPAYAPDLPLTGLALGGLPTAFDEVIGTVSGTTNAGLGLLILAAFHRLSPASDLPALLNDQGNRMLTKTQDYCGADFLTRYPFADIDTFTRAPGIGSHPRIQAIARGLDLDATAPPPAPTYLWHSTEDDVLPIATTDRLVAAWRGAGAPLTYVRTHDPSHASSGIAGFPAAFDYLAERFAG